MSFRFTRSDFNPGDLLKNDPAFDAPGWAAEVANYLLDEYVKALPEVFTDAPIPNDPFIEPWTTYQDKLPGGEANPKCSHRARLWGVAEINERECDHRIRVSTSDVWKTDNDEFMATCQSCGTKMVAKWEEA